MNKIFIDGRQFNFEVQKKVIRSIRLRLVDKDTFIISCPHFTSDRTINNFIQTNSDWIIKQSSKLTKKKSLIDLKSLEILGDKYEVIWHSTSNNSILVFDQERQIHINTSSFSETHLKKLIDSKLKIHALILIKKELVELSRTFGFKYSRISVRNQKSRYGSCSYRGNLNFNWQIILFPTDVFRHILLHELTHLQIKNHSKTFWNQLAIYDPNCFKNNHWLKKEGNKHFLIYK